MKTVVKRKIIHTSCILIPVDKDNGNTTPLPSSVTQTSFVNIDAHSKIKRMDNGNGDSITDIP